MAHWTFTQRTIRAVLPIKAELILYNKCVSAGRQTLGDFLVACRKEAGFTQKELALETQIRRKWLGRWERNRAVPGQEDLRKLSKVLKLPPCLEDLANNKDGLRISKKFV